LYRSWHSRHHRSQHFGWAAIFQQQAHTLGLMVLTICQGMVEEWFRQRVGLPWQCLHPFLNNTIILWLNINTYWLQYNTITWWIQY
jgi:hypothetical protein